MPLYFVLFVIELLVCALVGYLLSERAKTKQTVRDTILGAAVGTLLLSVPYLQHQFLDLRAITSQLLCPNELQKLDNTLAASQPDSMLRSSLNARKTAIENELQTIATGTIPLRDADEVVAEWQRLFNQSATSIAATNYVSPSFWLTDSDFSQEQRAIHEAARSRGVSIRRIFIYDPDLTSDINKICALAEDQRHLGITVRFIDYNKVVSSQAFLKYSPMLHGAIDFVLYDTSAALLTFPHPETHEIQRGLLTEGRNVADAARDLFESLWNMSSEAI